MSIQKKQVSMMFKRSWQACVVAMVALVLGAGIPASADTVWTAGSATVSDLLTSTNWSNGSPTSLDNPGTIDGTNEITNSTNWYPGAAGQDVDVTFGGTSKTTINGYFAPLKNITSGLASVSFTLKDSANVYATNNFWGGTNASSTFSPTHGNAYPLYQNYTGNSTFSSNEWWSGMGAKTSILISDNASVTSRGGNSGIGWTDSSYGSVIKMTDSSKLSTVAFQVLGSTMTMSDNATASSSGITYVQKDNSQLRLYDNASYTAGGELNVSNAGAVISATGESTITSKNTTVYSNGNITLGGSSTLTTGEVRINNGAINVTEDSSFKSTGTLYIGYDQDGARFNQTGGTVTATGTVYFGYHQNATVNLSGGTFTASGYIYGSDGKAYSTTLNMSGDAYLKAANLAWGQHGNNYLTMTDNAKMEATSNLYLAFHCDNGDTTQTTLNMSGKSSIVTNSNLIPFAGRSNNETITGYASINMTDSSSISVKGNFWGGQSSNMTINPPSGKTYALDLSFADNSTFAATGEAWFAMSAKTHVTIADNAKVSSGSGTSGIVCYDGSSGSVLDMTGGTLAVQNLSIQKVSTFNLSGNAFAKTNSNFTFQLDSTMTVAEDSYLRVGGSAYFASGTSTNYGSAVTYTQTGGTVAVYGGDTFWGKQGSATIDISGGEFISNSNYFYFTDNKSVTANVVLSGDAYVQGKDVRLSQHGTTNVTMSDNSSFKANQFNIVSNWANGDNAQTTVSMTDSSKLTANTVTFFYGNLYEKHTGAGYGSFTMADNTSAWVYGATQVGMSDTYTPGVISGKDYNAEITLGGDSSYTTGTFVTASGTKALVNMNDNATLNTTTLAVNSGSTFNFNGGSINLNPYGYIKATDGTFNANGGAITASASNKISYKAGDQMITGLFTDSTLANTVSNMTTLPEGWSKSVLDVNGKYAVVASYGDAATGVKYWNSGSWAGATSNNTGFILDGTNTFSSTSGQMVFLDGTNTVNAGVASGSTVVVSNGTVSLNGSVSGSLFANGGTVSFTNGDKSVEASGYLEINGGTVSTGTGWFRPYGNSANIVVNNGNLTIGGNGIAMKGNSKIIVNNGSVTFNQLYMGDEDSGNENNSYIQNNGTTTVTGAQGNVYVALKAGTNGTLTINDGIFTCSGTIQMATKSNTTGSLNINGGYVRANRVLNGRAGAGDSSIVNVTGGILHITQDLCGSGGTASGKTFVTGTGQIQFDSTYTAMALIREQMYFGIEGSGSDGTGALRFIQSATSTSDITLTDNATIGIQGGQTFTMNAVFNVDNPDTVLTVKGGMLNLTSSKTGTLQNINLEGTYLTINNGNYQGEILGDADSKVTFAASSAETLNTFTGSTIQAGNIVFDGASTYLSADNVTLTATEKVSAQSDAVVLTAGSSTTVNATTVDANGGQLVFMGDKVTVNATDVSITNDGALGVYSSEGTVNVSNNMNIASGIVDLSGTTATTLKNLSLGSNGQTAGLYISGDSTLHVTEKSVTMNFTTGTAKGVFSISDNAVVTFDKEFWVGIADRSACIQPLDGEDYVFYQYFSGNSKFTTNEWWAGITAKTYISISDNATITSKAGNTGLGWDDGAYGSVLDMTGGTLSVANMWNYGSTMNYSGNAVVNVSGTLYNNYSENFFNVSDNATIKISGGLQLGQTDGMSTYNQTGGQVTVAGTAYLSYHGNAAMNMSGGSFIVTNNYTYVTDQKNKTANITLSGDALMKVNIFRLSQHGHTTLDMSGNATLKATEFLLGYNCDNGDNVQTYVTMSGNSSLYADKLVSFQGNNDNNHQTAGYASFSMTDNAQAYITGNTWGGSNDENNYATLISGKNYSTEFYFGGNSTYSTGEFWMAMAGKVHVTIDDNATVTARSGSSGLGWSKTTGGSLLEIKGGNLNIYSTNFYIGHSGTVAASVKQTGGNALYSNINMRTTGSSYEFSGADSTLTIGSFNTVAGSNFTIADGTVNLGSLSNAGTTTINSGTINLQPYGSIVSTSGTFNANGGTINALASDTMTYSNGDQMIVGLFADDTTANAVYDITTVPTDWVKSVVSASGYSAVVASYKTTPTSVKIWTPGGNGSMTDSSKWEGDYSNPTGFVVSGTNTLSNISGKTVAVGGTNTFSGNLNSGATVVVSGGTASFSADNYGNLIVNGGTANVSNSKIIQDSGYVEVNGGTLSYASGNWTWLRGNVVLNNGVVSFGEGLAMQNHGKITVNNGSLSAKRIIIGDNSGYKDVGITQNGGSVIISGNLEIGQKANVVGTYNLSGGALQVSGTTYVGSGAEGSGTGYLNVSGGTLYTNQLDVGYGASGTVGLLTVTGGDIITPGLLMGLQGSGDKAKVDLKGGTITITSQINGQNPNGCGNMYISGTGQLIVNSSRGYDNTYATVREMSNLKIEGSGSDGTGAILYLLSADCSVPVTLTDDATIGIQSGAIYNQKAVFNTTSTDNVLTLNGGGTMLYPSANSGSLRNVTLNDGTTWKFNNTSGDTHATLSSVSLNNDSIMQFASTSGMNNVALSSVALDGGTLEFSEGTTVSPGTSTDKTAFSVAITGSGQIVLNGTLHLDAYYNSKSYGLDKLDFTNMNLETSEVVLGNDFKVVVDLQDPSVFYNQMVSLDWAPGLQDKLVSEYDIPLDVLNNGNIQYWWFNSDGSIFLGDANAVPEPSTWALLILGFAGLMWYRRRNEKR